VASMSHLPFLSVCLCVCVCVCVCSHVCDSRSNLSSWTNCSIFRIQECASRMSVFGAYEHLDTKIGALL
jgi:hypothetical protein